MNQTMKKLQKMQEAEYSSFIRVMFGLSSSSPVPANLDEDTAGMEWVDPSLNDSQKHAIKFALASREIALIHGPPGVSSPTDTERTFTDISLDRQNAHID
jgi:DNA polymerase alpha-associated DNA helicase A